MSTGMKAMTNNLMGVTMPVEKMEDVKITTAFKRLAAFVQGSFPKGIVTMSIKFVDGEPVELVDEPRIKMRFDKPGGVRGIPF